MDIDVLGEGGAPEHPWGVELHAFASAAVALDDARLQGARLSLTGVAGVAATIDAAAVVANFEMMTRLADGTGARMPTELIDARSDVIDAMRAANLTSRR